MRAFVQAVLLGTLAASCLPLIWTIGMTAAAFPSAEHSYEGIAPLLWLALMPLLFTAPIVLLCSVVVGLPVTALLKSRGRESAEAYIIIGAVAGLAIPFLFLVAGRYSDPSGYWVCLVGSFSGGVTGQTWWRYGRKPKGR